MEKNDPRNVIQDTNRQEQNSTMVNWERVVGEGDGTYKFRSF